MPREDGGARTLVLMRHGETAWNRERRIMGAADIALSEAGRAQCLAAAAVLASFGVDTIVSSPLRRARESADIVAAELGLPVETDADLEEVRFGSWQGKTYEDVIDEPACRAFLEDPVHNPTPGGETIVDVQRRGLSATEAAAPGRRTLFVSHGDILRAVLCHHLAVPLAEFRRLRVDNGGLSALSVRGGAVEVKFLNCLPDPRRAWDPVHWSARS